MKICHVTPYFSPAFAYGGIVRLASDLAFAQAKAGYRISVATTDVFDEKNRTEAAGVFAENGVTIFRSRNLSNRLAYHAQFFTPINIGSLYGAVDDADVVHIHGCRHPLGSILIRRARANGTPLVLTPNGTLPRIERFKFIKSIYDRVLFTRELELADVITAVSESEVKQFNDYGVAPEKIKIVPDFIDTDNFPAQSEMKSAGDRILFLGKITPRKEVVTLIKAFDLLKTERAELFISGNVIDGERAIEKAITLSAKRNKITRIGFQPLAEKIELMQGASVVVYAGRDEIFGLVPLESLLCGTPAIVADDSGCGEIFQKYRLGATVPPGDPASLARAIEKEIKSPTYPDVVKERAVIVRREFSIGKAVKNFEAIYKELL